MQFRQFSGLVTTKSRDLTSFLLRALNCEAPRELLACPFLGEWNFVTGLPSGTVASADTVTLVAPRLDDEKSVGTSMVWL